MKDIHKGYAFSSNTIFLLLCSFGTLFSRDEDPVLAKKPDPGLCNSHEGRFLKVLKANIIDNLKSHLFCFHTFGVRRAIDVLDSENKPGSGSGPNFNGSGSGIVF